MFTIGEFSRVTGLTVKTLRFYHEQGLLVPARVDPRTGYRHYDPDQIADAHAVAWLRDLQFTVKEIKSLLDDADDDAHLLDVMRRQREAIHQRLARDRSTLRSLDQFIEQERKAAQMSDSPFDIQIKTLDPVTVAAVRIKGRYSDCGKAFAMLGRHLGRFMCGKPFLLHHDAEYKEDDADFEACVPVRRRKETPGVDFHDLPRVQCVALMHKGPYPTLGSSYARILTHIKQHGLTVDMPTREVYIKGPGMIFKGNPRNYLTEIQFPLTPDAPAA